MKYTPPPWTLSPDKTEISASDGTIYYIALMNESHPAWKDNGRVVIAAPELLAAATAMLARHDAKAQAANFTRCGCEDCEPFRAIVNKLEEPR